MKTKILFAESGTGYGGSARYLSELLAQLDRSRFELEVAASEEGPFIKKIQDSGVPVTLRPRWKFEGPAAVLRVPGILLWLLRRRIRIVHLNNEILTHIPMIAAARLAGCKILCHLHGWRPMTRIEKFFLPFVHEWVAISEAGAAYYTRELGGRKVRAVPNGIAVNGQFDNFEENRRERRAGLGFSEEEIVVLISGRLVPWKGQTVFLEAFAKAAEKHPYLRAVILGRDPDLRQAYLKRLKELARNLRLESKVRFIDWVPDVWPLYAAADLVVHASTSPEPFGLVILEAMFAKRPVIASLGGGVSDMVRDGETGWLVTPESAGELAHAMGRAAGDPGLAAQMAVNAQTRARKYFCIEKNAEQVAWIYESMLRGSKSGSRHS